MFFMKTNDKWKPEKKKKKKDTFALLTKCGNLQQSTFHITAIRHYT